MKKSLVVLVLGLFACSVNATIIDFEPGPIGSTGSYSEDGYNLTVNNFNGNNAALTTTSAPGNSSIVFGFCTADSPFTTVCGTNTFLSLTGTTDFSISSFDVANFQTETSPGTIGLQGNISGGGTITQTFSTFNTWATYSLVGFDNLTSLDIVGLSAVALTIDNLDVTAIPEPASLALLGLGLAGIGFSRKKKTA